MDAGNYILLVGALLLFVSVFMSVVSARLGFPLLLVFLIVGMLAGEDGPGGMQFSNFSTAVLFGNLALAIILLDGGLRTKLETFRVALRPALVLATLGVVLTVVVTGAFAMFVLDLEWRYAMLLGAVVGSTDAAAVFALLRHSGVRLNERVGATLEIESGANDPMAIFLTLTLIELVSMPSQSGYWMVLLNLVQQFGIGAVGGLVAGVAISRVLDRIRLVEGLYPLLVASAGIVSFAIINVAGGSGFLGVYLIGVVVGNRRNRATEPILGGMDGFAWLAQAGLFLMLGLLVTPSSLVLRIDSALWISAVLILIARPIAVWLCLLPFRFPPRETAYIAWVGLRGAVPIVLGSFPVLAGVQHAFLIFEVTFVVVVVSLIVQGSTVSWMARRLGVEVPPSYSARLRSDLHLGGPMGYEFVEFEVADESRAAERHSDALPLPEAVRLAAHVRDGQLLPIHPAQLLKIGDIVCLIAPLSMRETLAELFTPGAKAPHLQQQRFFGDFVLDGGARFGDVAAMYGFAASGEEGDLSLAAALHQRLRGRAVVGDSVAFGKLMLTVREMDGKEITRVGLKLR